MSPISNQEMITYWQPLAKEKSIFSMESSWMYKEHFMRKPCSQQQMPNTKQTQWCFCSFFFFASLFFWTFFCLIDVFLDFMVSNFVFLWGLFLCMCVFLVSFHYSVHLFIFIYIWFVSFFCLFVFPRRERKGVWSWVGGECGVGWEGSFWEKGEGRP